MIANLYFYFILGNVGITPYILGFFTICSAFFVWKYLKKTPNKFRRNLFSILTVIIATAGFLIKPSSASTLNKPVEPTKQAVKTVVKTKYIGKKDYVYAKKQHVLLLAKKKELTNELSVINKQEAEKKAQKQAQQKQLQEQQRAQASQQNNNEKIVYIAPNSGRKYHYDRNCRGLKRATSIISMSISEATAKGYSLCGWED